jgi:REP element-mobilizing transposase RayT
MHLFRMDADFEAFERMMAEAHDRQPIRILSYCVLPNHWHFVVWPEKDGQLTYFFRRLAHTHAVRWRVSHATRSTVGRRELSIRMRRMAAAAAAKKCQRLSQCAAVVFQPKWHTREVSGQPLPGI